MKSGTVFQANGGLTPY